jgi:hypothetical protein
MSGTAAADAATPAGESGWTPKSSCSEMMKLFDNELEADAHSRHQSRREQLLTKTVPDLSFLKKFC